MGHGSEAVEEADKDIVSLLESVAGHAAIISVRVPVSMGTSTCALRGHTCIRGGIRGNGYSYPRIQVLTNGQVLMDRDNLRVF